MPNLQKNAKMNKTFIGIQIVNFVFSIRDGVFCQYKHGQDGKSITNFINSGLWMHERAISNLDDSNPDAPFYTQISPLFDVIFKNF